ncbi:nuclear transport factor 2 family protein [Sphingomonas jatrophae]|uniref:SnoaL-like domain-containing protein n=1 Tax=Sphingomonas jatrophae TaxID=1166337 RepID=A0A1I6M075_9SPHN|nr:nuclear transport factor 2 family protein [Sphingomonas jatrophae]SFS09075.1 SnoaL-like domain-containing protein [Sphingomonas jatrophae]
MSNNSAPSLRAHAWTLQEMLDKSALEELAMAYCHAVDRQDYVLLRSLYHDDAIDDHGPMFYGSPDEYVAWLPSMLSNWSATSHQLSNMLFLVDGDRAEGELAVTAYHRTKDDRREMIAHGRYMDSYEKRDGIWKFFRRSLALDWMEDRAFVESEGPRFDDGVMMGAFGADDPVYARLPMFKAQRSAPALVPEVAPLSPDHIRSVFVRYGELMTAGDVEGVTALFAPLARHRDPVNGPLRIGRDAIRAYYRDSIDSMGGGIEMKLEGSVRIAGAHAAAAYIARTIHHSQLLRSETLDVMTFDNQGLIESFDAYWGEANFTPDPSN